jgi:hypothetical protein
MLLRLANNHGVALLKNLVYRDQGLERLDLVGEDGLPVKNEAVSAIMRMPHSMPVGYPKTYTFMPAQKAADDLWSHV